MSGALKLNFSYIKNMHHLLKTAIKLRYCGIYFILPGALDSLTALKQIDLSYNNLFHLK